MLKLGSFGVRKRADLVVSKVTSYADRAPAPRRRVSAIVLAAGTSSRMQELKPLVRLAGRPLLVHVLEGLRKSSVREIVVVLGAEADRVRREIPLNALRVVENPDYAQGMSTSIRAGLRVADPAAEAFLIVLGDQPFVAVSTVDALVGGSAQREARIWIPTYHGVRGNPVLFDRSLSREMEAVRGDIGCRDIIEAHPREIVEVSVGDPGILIDADTPEDLRRIEMALDHGGSLEALADERVRATR